MPGETLHCAEDLKRLGQEHVLQYWGILTPEERNSLMKQLAEVNFEQTNAYFAKCFGKVNHNDINKASPSKMQPLPKDRYCCASDLSPQDQDRFFDIGLQAIADGRVGVLLLAGGQGTRLGVSYPKGMYNVGLPSGKVLYHLQAERILRLQNMVAERYDDRVSRSGGKIMWYIMTSEATDELTEAYFQSHSYFGLEPSQVVFFEQGLLPCYNFEGKVILETRSRLAMAPDGNGGLYRALLKNRVLENMESHNIQYLHVYCVDNILVRMADPWFVGYCIANNADCGNKVVEKIDPKEPVGVVCWLNGLAYVVEYSELPEDMAQRRDEDGRLTFRAGNIANHFFTRAFLRRVCQESEQLLVHHVAKKKIPYFGLVEGGVHDQTIQPSSPNGIKMEKFVFDVFQFSRNFYVFEAPRSSEFSPLKNATGVDSPATCRHDLFALHRKWLISAGAQVVGETASDEEAVVEISPLISHAGEGLEPLVKGKELHLPIHLDSTSEKNGQVSSEKSDSGLSNSEKGEKEELENSSSDKTLPLDSEGTA